MNVQNRIQNLAEKESALELELAWDMETLSIVRENLQSIEKM